MCTQNKKTRAFYSVRSPRRVEVVAIMERAPVVVMAMLTWMVVHMSGVTAVDEHAFNQTEAMVPAVIAFGDSIVDPGNNNVLKTIIQCNFPPYGKDFAGQQATGRFCNGRIPTDLMAERLGVKYLLPPYLGVELSPEDILTGVSFASGASGYDPLTPAILNVISMPDQLGMFDEYKGKMKAIAGEEKAAKIVNDALYVVCTGTDDIANTYFTTPFRQKQYDVPSYVELLISGAVSFLQELHEKGARKVAFVGLPPIGCVPSQRTLAGGVERKCDSSRNNAAQLFNKRIQEEINSLVSKPGYHDTKLVYIDIYSILLDMINHPSTYGFEESTKGCCGTGVIEVTKLCNSKTAGTCADVSKYVFWDSYHPTERAYGILVNKIFDKYIKYLF